MSTAASWFRISFEVEGRTVNRFNDRSVATIGRSPECNIVLAADTVGVGRNHAVFRLTPNGWMIEDNQSRNGTFVNRERVESPRLLSPGDVINLGPFEIDFEEAGSADASAGSFDLDVLSARTPGVVSFDDDSRPQVSNTVNLAAMSLALGGSAESLREADLSGLAPDSAAGPIAAEGISGVRGIQLFHMIGEALLTSTDLSDMLTRILRTVFDIVPARSGMIGLRDAQGEVVPRVSESRSMEELRISRSIVQESLSTESAILVEDTGSSAQFAHAPSINALKIHSAMCVPLYHDGTASGVIYVETHRDSQPFTREHLELVSALSLFSAIAVKQAALREEFAKEQKRREGLSRYFSPAVVDQIIERSESLEPSMLAEEREVTVLFADLRGFTAMSEKMSPQDVVRLINEIWERMNNVVFRHYGALDKFMGDGMMAFFGAPLAINNHAVAAVRAGLEMQAELRRFNESSGHSEVGMRIGINGGPVLMGDIGSESRKDFTVIGDTVNVASRLESTVAAPGQVIIGPATFEQVKDLFHCEPCEAVPLKGKSQTVQPYVVHSLRAADESGSSQ